MTPLSPWAIIRCPMPTAQPERDRAVLLVLAALTERVGEPVRCSLTALAARCGTTELRTVARSLVRLAECGLIIHAGADVVVDGDAIAALGRSPAWTGRVDVGNGLGAVLTRHYAQSGDRSDSAPCLVPGTMPTRHHADPDSAPCLVGDSAPCLVGLGTMPSALYMALSGPSFTGPFLAPQPNPPCEVREEQEVGGEREVGGEETITARVERRVVGGREVGGGAPGGLEVIARDHAPRRTREELDAALMARLFPSASPRPLLAPLAATLTAILGGYQKGTGEGEEETVNAAWDELAACTARDTLGELRARLVARAKLRAGAPTLAAEAMAGESGYPHKGER